MLRSALVLLLLLGAVPSRAALVAGPERPVTAPKLGAAGISDLVDVATDGTDFLVLWRETTTGPREGLYASIVNEEGVPRPVAPPRLAPRYTLASAVWTGDAYLVILHSEDVTSAVRLNRDGQVISGPMPVDAGPGFVVDLAWNGSRALALVSPGATLSGALLDGQGRVLRSGIPIPATDVQARTVAAAGDAFVVAWADELEPPQVGLPPLTSARAVRISAEGEVSAPKELLTPLRAVVEIASASSGNDAGIAVMTRDYRQPYRDLLRFTIDGAAFAVDAHRKISLFPDIEALQVVPVSGGFAAAWAFYPSDALMLGVVRFDATATRSVRIGSANLVGDMRLETNGRSVVAVWRSTTILGVAFDTALTRRKRDLAPVSLAWTQQSTPVLASAGATMLAAWIESGYPESTLLAQRRDAEGNALDAEPIVVARGVASPVAVAFTGRVWLVAWGVLGYSNTGVTSDVYVRRISPEGILLDPEPIHAGRGSKPALASNGNVTALVMDHVRFEPLRLVRFSPEGTILDSTQLTDGTPRADSPAIATNGQEFLVTWTTEPNDVAGRRLAADGTPMDAAPIAIATGPMAQGEARVASNGTDFVVAYGQWESYYAPSETPKPDRVFTKRVLRNGTLADTTPQQDGTLLGEGTLPRIAAFGEGYVVTFVGPQEPPYDRLSLFAVPLDGRGAMLAPPRAVVTNAHSHHVVHALAVTGDNVHVAYARVAPELGDVHRVYLRTLTEQVSRRRVVR